MSLTSRLPNSRVQRLRTRQGPARHRSRPSLELHATFSPESSSYRKREARSHTRLEGSRRPVPAAFPVAQRLSDRQFNGSVCGALGPDVPQPGGVLLDHRSTGDSRRRLSGSRVHHSPRLWPRFVLQIPASQRPCGVHHGRADLHAVPSLALDACRPPRGVQRSGPARLGLRAHVDGPGILGRSSVEAPRLPPDAEPVRALPAGRQLSCFWSCIGFPLPVRAGEIVIRCI